MFGRFVKPLFKSLLLRDYVLPIRFLTALSGSPNAQLDKNAFHRYMDIPVSDCKIQTCYVWIDGSGINLRCKSRTLGFVPNSYEELPHWMFDGSSTGQSKVHNSDCQLVPVAMYDDPMRGGNNKLVLCETYDGCGCPTKTNHRNKCVSALNEVTEDEPAFGFEQEFLLVGPDRRPFGWPLYGEPINEALHYCGLGANNNFGRMIIESFYRCCLYCGIDIYGTNAEVMYSQWEFQTGPTINIKAADDLWMARFLLVRVAEDFGVSVSFEPKPFKHLSGSGMHTNYSTKQMREDDGIEYIKEAIEKLGKTHSQHIKVYDLHGGDDNRKRLTGLNETAHIDKFSSGVGDRSASVRIPLQVVEAGRGFLEDRRPAANADPYQIINVLIRSTLL